MLSIKSIIKKIIGWDKRILPFEFYEKKSYSQSGEDLIIDYIFRAREINKPSYLDIGANHPFDINNTFLFYNRGSCGVNIDANPEMIKLFLKHRPKDISINLGIGEMPGKQDFFITSNPALSTFSKEEVEEQTNYGNLITKKITVEVKTLPQIIDKYFKGIYPDFISIDVEGLDEVIISNMDLSISKPKVICLETVEYTPDGTGDKRVKLIQKVIAIGYTVYADTNINTIFVENHFWFKN